MNRRAALLGIALLALVPACGGGGGGGPQATIVQGNAQAPGGSLSSLVSGSLTPTLGPVVGANVFVFKIDENGDPVGAPILTTTTDANGNFSFVLPAGGFQSDTIVQISTLGTPSSITGATISGAVASPIACPLAGTTLNIDPSAELATRLVLGQIAAVSGDLANFTPGEIGNWVGVIQTQFLNDPALVGTTVEDTIANLTAVLPPELNDVLDGFDDPGNITAPVGFGGTYGFVEYGLSDGGNQSERRVSRGTITVNAVTGALTFAGSESRMSRNETCTGDCDRTFNNAGGGGTFDGTGSVVLAGGGLALFTFRDSQDPADETQTVLGNISTDGSIVLLPFLGEQDISLVVALKHTVAALHQPVTTLNGDYGFSAILCSVPAGGGFVGSWTGIESSVDRGGLIFSGGGGTYVGNSTGDDMEDQITCAGSPCNLTATISTNSVPQTLGGTFTVDATGGVGLEETVGDIHGLAGQVNPSTQLLALRVDDGDSFGLVFAARRGVNMNAADLSGDYGFATIEELRTTDAQPHIESTTGTFTFDGAGTFTLVMTHSKLEHTSCAGGNSCNESVTRDSQSVTDGGTYTVDPLGNVTVNVTGGGATLTGTLSGDGSALILHQVDDTASDSGRMILIGVK